MIILAAKSVLVFRCVAFFTMLNAPLNGGRGKEGGWEGERGRVGGEKRERRWSYYSLLPLRIAWE